MRKPLLIAAIVLALLTVACSGGSKPAATPSATTAGSARATLTAQPSATATVAPALSPTSATVPGDSEFRWQPAKPAPCPLPERTPCDVAVSLNAAIRSGDASLIAAFGEPLTVTCPPDSQRYCGSPGETRKVFASGKWGGGAGIVSPDAFAMFIAESLGSASRLPSGERDANVASVGCKAEASPNRCTEFAVVLTLSHDSGDQMLQFAFRTDSPSAAPRFFGLVNNVPWERTLRSGEPTPSAYLGAAGALYAVSAVSFQVWTPP